MLVVFLHFATVKVKTIYFEQECTMIKNHYEENKAAKEKIQVPWNRNIGLNNKRKLVSDEKCIKYFD